MFVSVFTLGLLKIPASMQNSGFVRGKSEKEKKKTLKCMHAREGMWFFFILIIFRGFIVEIFELFKEKGIFL